MLAHTLAPRAVRARPERAARTAARHGDASQLHDAGFDGDVLAGRLAAGIVTLAVAIGLLGLLVVEYGLLWHALVAPWVRSLSWIIPGTAW